MLGKRAPIGTRLIGPFGLKLVLWAARKIAPFDIEAYFRRHFTKVGAQTRQTFATYAELAATYGMETPAVDELGRRLRSNPE